MIYIYTLSYCNYCHKALDLLKQLKIPYKNIIVDKNKEKIKLKNKMKTFPQIFMKNNDNKMIKLGGYDDFYNIVKKLCKNGKINILLNNEKCGKECL